MQINVYLFDFLNKLIYIVLINQTLLSSISFTIVDYEKWLRCIGFEEDYIQVVKYLYHSFVYLMWLDVSF